jgi:energy-coupling factor transport system ATP-binding protein
LAPAIEAKNLWFGYERDQPILRDLSFTLKSGEFMALIGQNGSGKTTLAKHMIGLLRPTQGRILIGGEDTAGISTGMLARSVGYVFQNPDHQIFAHTVRQEISFGLAQLALDPAEERQRIQQVMEQFDLAEHAEQSPHQLSFGLRRKLTVASVVAMRAPIHILDEPTAGLDCKSAIDLMDIVSQVNEQGHSILLITHDMRLVAAYASKTALIHAGQIAAVDDTRQILYRAELLKSTRIEPPQIVRLSQSLDLDQSPLTAEELCSVLTKNEMGI